MNEDKPGPVIPRLLAQTFDDDFHYSKIIKRFKRGPPRVLCIYQRQTDVFSLCHLFRTGVLQIKMTYYGQKGGIAPSVAFREKRTKNKKRTIASCPSSARARRRDFRTS
ncbi:hypothetical protein Trydic_g11245 [Trypoxylus dichotomus]